MLRVADYIFEKLHDQGVAHVFMVTGRGALFLSDAVARHKGLAGISVHHEQAAAYAAIAYSQYNDQIGACLVSTGCAGTNALTGVLSAWQDGIPCMFISGQNTLKETSRYTGIPLRTFGQQEADLIPIVESITKYAVMITDASKIVYEVEKALYLANSGRKGPVWIDVPLDIQNIRIEPDELEHFNPEEEEEEKVAPTPEDIDYVLHALSAAKRPVILIGSGVRSAHAVNLLKEFLENNPFPVVYSGSAPDTYGTEYPLSIGSIGMMGCSRAGNFTVQNADFLLVLGNRLSSMTTGTDYCKFARDAKTVVVDIDSVEHSKSSVEIDRLILADVNRFLFTLMQNLVTPANEEWKKQCLHWKEVFPKCEENFKGKETVDIYYLAERLSETLPEQSVFVSDSGLAELILPTNISFSKGTRCVHPASQGAMGFALPAAVGAYYSSKLPVIAAIGDGSIMMNLQELETIRYNKIPVKILVINNNAYAVIRKRQVDLFRRRTIGTDPANGISCPDFEKVANSFEIPYVSVDSPDYLQEKLTGLFEMEGPVLCEIISPEDQDYLTIAYAKTADGKVVQRPLEDQAPFLDREMFLTEMLIEPIDQ